MADAAELDTAAAIPVEYTHQLFDQERIVGVKTAEIAIGIAYSSVALDCLVTVNTAIEDAAPAAAPTTSPTSGATPPGSGGAALAATTAIPPFDAPNNAHSGNDTADISGGDNADNHDNNNCSKAPTANEEAASAAVREEVLQRLAPALPQDYTCNRAHFISLLERNASVSGC